MLKKIEWQIIYIVIKLLSFSMIAKIPGAIKESVVASVYGVNSAVDCYNFALAITTYVPTLIFSCFAGIFIPHLAFLQTVSSEEKKSFLRELNLLSLFIGIMLCCLNYSFAPSIVAFFIEGVPEGESELAIAMMCLLSPICITTVLFAAAAVQLASVNNHVYALLEGVPATVIVCVLASSKTNSPYMMIYGTLLGAFFQLMGAAAVIFYSSPKGLTCSFAASLCPKKWRGTIKSTGLFMAGQISLSLSVPIDQFYVGHLGAGSFAIFGYATRIISLFNSFFASVIGRVATPVFSHWESEGNTGKVRTQASFYLCIITVSGALLACTAWYFSINLVTAVFGRGNFSGEAIDAVTKVMQVGIWSVPFYGAAMLFASVLVSQKRYYEIFLGSSVAVAIKFGLVVLFIDRMAIEAVLLSNVGMYVGLFLVYLMLARNSKARSDD